MNPTGNTIREIILSDEFSGYYDSLSAKARDKYAYAMQIIMTQKTVSEKFVKKILNTEFYEVRVSVGTNEYRTILIAVDKPNFIEATRAVFLNSFLKKGNNQYKREIEKARTVMKREKILL